MACIIKESTLDFLDLIPTFDLLREKVNAQTEQMKKISDFISTVENAPNKEELKKVICFF